MSGASWAHLVENDTWVACPVRCVLPTDDTGGGVMWEPGAARAAGALARAMVYGTSDPVVDPQDRTTWEDLERVPNRVEVIRDSGWASSTDVW